MKTDEAKLGERRAQVLDFYNRETRMPSFAEMAELFGLRSKNSVAKVVSQLEKKGVLRRTGDGHIALVERGFVERIVEKSVERPAGLPLIGSVGAAIPSLAEEDFSNVLELDTLLVRNRPSTFLLTVFGDSMIDAGIMPDDIVVIDTSLQPRVNDIVVACVDGEWTMKYFHRDGNGKVHLVAGNPKYAPIYPKEQLVIHSVVVSSMRTYR